MMQRTLLGDLNDRVYQHHLIEQQNALNQENFNLFQNWAVQNWQPVLYPGMPHPEVAQRKPLEPKPYDVGEERIDVAYDDWKRQRDLIAIARRNLRYAGAVIIGEGVVIAALASSILLHHCH